MKDKKASKVFDELLSRQNYLVVQGNDLAKAFGGLSTFEHQLLDYCFSYVTAESKYTDTFTAHAIEIFKHFGLSKNGNNYERVVRAFKRLNEKTALYLPIVEPDGTPAIVMTQLFSEIVFNKKGRISFEFSKRAMPLIFDLNDKYYSFHLGELARIKGKYALILLKLWEANRRIKGQRVTIISGSLEEWQGWFLAENKRMSAGVFKRDVLHKACEEIEKMFDVSITLTTEKRGRTVVGYEMEIIDKRQPNMAYFEQQQKELDKQREEEMRMNRIFDTNEDGGIFGVSETQMDIYDILKELE